MTDPSVSLPYWDWTSEISLTSGIPKPFGASVSASPDAECHKNPLCSAIVTTTGKPTERFAREPAVLGAVPGQVASALLCDEFVEFSSSILDPHDAVHAWVRGSMGHMTFAESIRCFGEPCQRGSHLGRWQRDWGNESIPCSILTDTLSPFCRTVGEVLNCGELGYEYDDLGGPSDAGFRTPSRRGMITFERPPASRPARVLLRVLSVRRGLR